MANPIDELSKQITAEEKLASTEVSKLLTTAVNAKKVRDGADRLKETSGGWPYPPDKDILNLLTEAMDDEWKKLARKYDAFTAELTLDAKKGKPPAVNAELKFDGAFKGGKSVVLKRGDTLTSIAKAEYGYQAYSAVVWEENDKVLGAQCKTLPAGFGLELPQIWVPNWKTEPKLKVPGGASSKAEEVKLPKINVTFGTKGETKAQVDVGVAILILTFTVSGDVTIKNDGIIDAGFQAGNITAGIERTLGPLKSGFEVDLKKKEGDAGLSVSLVNANFKDLKFSSSVKLTASGKLSLDLGVCSFKKGDGDVEVSGTFKAKVSIEVMPKPSATAEVYEASIAAHLAVAVILAPIAIEVVSAIGGALEIEGFGSAAARALKEIVEVAPKAIRTM
jgi:nucleoid-associated protein YgaU